MEKAITDVENCFHYIQKNWRLIILKRDRMADTDKEMAG